MESKQKDLKMKLNDLEKNQKALIEMTYPKTMKPRTIVKARKSVTFKGGGSEGNDINIKWWIRRIDI